MVAVKKHLGQRYEVVAVQWQGARAIRGSGLADKVWGNLLPSRKKRHLITNQNWLYVP
jgi:hypothetical protein